MFLGAKLSVKAVCQNFRILHILLIRLLILWLFRLLSERQYGHKQVIVSFMREAPSHISVFL